MLRNLYDKMNVLKAKLTEVQNVKDTALENEEYLLEGKYTFFVPMKPGIYRNSKNPINYFENMHSYRHSKKAKLQEWFLKYYSLFDRVQINGESKKFSGEMMIITRKNDPKFFDFKKNKVITKIDNPEEFKKIIESYSFFKEYYPTTIIDFNIQEQIIYEELISSSIEYNKTKKIKIFKDIVKKTSKIIEKENYKKINLNYSINNQFNQLKKEINEDNIAFLKGKISEIPNIELPIYKSHGDLHYNNILLGDSQYYIIDWEDSHATYFFYDLLNILYQDKIDVRFDNSIFDDFIDGDFDVILSELFNIVNLDFMQITKDKWLVIYLIHRLFKIDQYLHQDINTVIDEYKQLNKLY